MHILTSLPVLTHPFTSWMSPRPIILNRMIRVRGSSTCSDVARSDLSFAFAYELGPFLFTLAPMTYGWSILAMREEYFERAASWSAVLSLACAATAVRGLFTAGRGATVAARLIEEVIPCALPVLTATCCRSRLYCLVKSKIIQYL